jgi:YhcH/YjgK/YiaL family protein
MVLDRLENAARYYALNPHFERAFAFLRQAGLAELEPGQHPVDGQVRAIVDPQPGRGRRGARLESHRQAIDIQYCLEGTDDIGWKPTAACRHSAADYDAGADVEKYFDEPELWVALPPGCFVILFPEDGHAPLGGETALKKVVMKVAVA